MNFKRYWMLSGLSCILIGLLLVKNSAEKEVVTDIYINEVCSGNDTIAYNENGDFYDYVELYNSSDKKISLEGYYLSDNEWHLRKMSLENYEIDADGYVIIFVNKEEHGFGVGDDEYLYLSKNKEGIIDSVMLPRVERDRAYARIDSGWENNQIPTPAADNYVPQQAVYELDETIELVLSQPSGFYDEDFMLEMETEEDCAIYYTLDGSEPTEESIRYGGPIEIKDVSSNKNRYSSRTDISAFSPKIPGKRVDKGNVIRAVAITNDNRISKEVTATFFVGFEKKYGYENICTVSLVTDPDNLFSQDRGIYVFGNLGQYHLEKGDYKEEETIIANYNREGDGWKRAANVQIFDEKRQSVFQSEIEISIHGGYSTYNSQKGFNLLTPADKDKQDYMFSFPDGSRYSSLMLRPGGIRDWESTQFRDVLNCQLIEDRNLTILEGMPCQVFVDGEYWGLYNLQERIDNGLIAQKFQVDPDNLIVTKQDYVVEGDDADYVLYEAVEDYAKRHDLSKKYYYNRVADMIDIQSFIEYHCFEIYIANVDSISNNYACWRVRETSDKPYCDGKWRWIIYDTDDSTGIIDDLSEPEVDSFVGGHWDKIPFDDPLFVALMENEDFKAQFVETFVEMADSDFAFSRVNELIDVYTDKYMEAAVLSRHRYGKGNYTEADYMADVEVYRDFYARRREYILKHLETSLGVSVEK